MNKQGARTVLNRCLQDSSDGQSLLNALNRILVDVISNNIQSQVSDTYVTVMLDENRKQELKTLFRQASKTERSAAVTLHRLTAEDQGFLVSFACDFTNGVANINSYIYEVLVGR